MRTFTIVEEERGIALVELNGLFYVVRYDEERGQFQSVIQPDSPPEMGCAWIASATNEGLVYVAGGRTRATARRWFRRMIALNEEES